MGRTDFGLELGKVYPMHVGERIMVGINNYHEPIGEI